MQDVSAPSRAKARGVHPPRPRLGGLAVRSCDALPPPFPSPRRSRLSPVLVGVGLSLLLHGGALAAFLALGEAGSRSPVGLIEVSLIARPVEGSSEPGRLARDAPAPRPAAGERHRSVPDSPERVAPERRAALPRPELKPALAELSSPGVRTATLPVKSLPVKRGSEAAEKVSWDPVAPERLVDPRFFSSAAGEGNRLGAPGPGSGLSALGRASEGSGLAGGSYSAPRFAIGSLDNPLPVYPPLARRRGIEGRAVLRVEVLPSGRSGTVVVSESSGHEILDRAAVEAVRAWRFVPARVGESAVGASVEVPITFRLE